LERGFSFSSITRPETKADFFWAKPSEVISNNKQDKRCFGRFIRSGGFADNISQLNLVCLLGNVERFKMLHVVG